MWMSLGDLKVKYVRAIQLLFQDIPQIRQGAQPHGTKLCGKNGENDPLAQERRTKANVRRAASE